MKETDCASNDDMMNHKIVIKRTIMLQISNRTDMDKIMDCATNHLSI